MSDLAGVNRKCPCTPGVAAADYVCTRHQYPWLIPLQNSEFKLNHLKTQNRSAAHAIGRMGHCTGIHRNCLSMFRFDQVFMLFSWMTQSWLAKSIN